nr:hypothetical protein [Tanacetum cinerariifolium]
MFSLAFWAILMYQPLHNEDFQEEIFSNPLFEEEIISIKKNQHHFNAESDLIGSLLNHNSSIISSSSKIDSLLDEFAGELTLLKSIPPGIDETDYHPENEIRLSQRLLYDNSSPHPPEEFNSENSNADAESFSPSPIMEEIDLTFTPDDPMPPSIEEDDDDSRDTLIHFDSTLKNDYFDTDSYLLESSLNRDTLMISSLKIDSPLAEFAEFVSENSNANIESFFPSPIPVEDSNSLMEKIDLSYTLDDPMPPSIEDDDDDSERDILIHKELLDNYSLSLSETESFRFSIPLFSRPPVKPPDDTLKQFDREYLHQLWALVKETLSIRQATKDKQKELWVELKRLFEPDFEDQLWTHNQNLMHDPLDWKFYDTCGVHHVFTKDQEIFMLVERDCPLRRGLAIVMICNKLQVENYSQMANDLILKIHNIANIIKIPLLEYFATVSAKEFLLLSCLVTSAEEFALLDEDKDYTQSKTHYSQSKTYVSYSWNVSCD